MSRNPRAVSVSLSTATVGIIAPPKSQTDRTRNKVAVRMTDRHSGGGFLVGAATQFFSLDPGWHYMAWRFLAFLPGVIVFALIYLLNLAIASIDRGTLADRYFRGADNGEILTKVWHFVECCKEKAPAYLVERDGFLTRPIVLVI